MGTLILLTAEAAHEGGFGLNFNILETNIINLAIVIGVLVYFGRNILGKVLADRRSQIEQAIQEAEGRVKEAAAALAEQQQKLAQAQTEAQRIKANAEASAQSLRESILKQADEDIVRMQSSAAQDLATQQERVIAELRQRVAAMAVQKAEAHLREQMGEDSQRQLIDRSIAMIGGS
ncbi:F0F1 ATP synthase subunit B [Leptolyngbya sp. NK1-12]|uniref:ATP synthase subunit b n=1 Tax=Leptolyngbya sp. NK1-12 TaxID=2547451 RepID=A0AA97AHS7_9CYAN|nr:F0F1 ATP synthase subunit B [Leptolyngbya sp. NK1-12]WNZ24854.1 F0F1 ATP synthase subunit B [Leptolyngbya sp. NK1-12]